jgi:hypothetical protein
VKTWIARRFPVLQLGCFFVLLLISMKSGVFEPKFDGRTFLVTGERVGLLQFDHLYEGLPGSGPWAYLAPAAQYFTLFSRWGFENGYRLFIVSNLVFLVLGIWLALKFLFEVENLRVREQRLIVGLALSVFWFSIWESLYVGQVDITLFSFLVSYLVFSKFNKDLLAGSLLGMICLFKVQFCIFLMVPIFQKRLVQVFSFFIAFAGLFLGFYVLHNLPFEMVLAHLKAYSDRAASIGSTIGPVNQSLQSVLTMLFGEDSYLGRFSPDWYNPGMLNYHWMSLSKGGVDFLIWGVRCLVLSVCVLLICRACQSEKKFSLESNLILLAAMPSLSPVFWQVHAIYLLLPFLWFALLIVQNRAQFQSLRWIFLLIGIVCFIANPVLIGKTMADWIQAKGVYYFSALIVFSVIGFCQFRQKSESCKVGI